MQRSVLVPYQAYLSFSCPVFYGVIIILAINVKIVSTINCTAGTYSSAISATNCTACAVGAYSTALGASSASVCTSCAAGTYATAVGSTSCIGTCFLIPAYTVDSACGLQYKGFGPVYYNCGKCTCPVGYRYVLEYDDKYYDEYCKLCTTGSFSSTNGPTVCSLCGPGTYSSSAGLSQCSLCSMGKYSNSSGSKVESSCILCSSGTYLSIGGASSCTACEGGKYNAATGAINCTLCDIGKYHSSTGALTSSNCTWCEAGTYSSTAGPTVCSLCSGVTYITVIGSTACSACAPGTYSTAIKRTACTNVFTWNASNYPLITPSATASLTAGAKAGSSSWLLPGNGVGITWSSWSCCTPTSGNGVWYLISGANNPATGQTFLQSIWALSSMSYITFTSGVSNDFYFPSVSKNMGFIAFELVCGTVSCGANVNFGVDLNKNGNIDFGTQAAAVAERGCGMSIGSISGRLHAADGLQTSYTGTLDSGTRWFKLRLIIDIQAETMRMDSKTLYSVTANPVYNSQWTPQISGVNASFNWGATDAQNPALWDGIMFSSCKESVRVPWFTFTTYPVIGTIFDNKSFTLQQCETGTFWVNSSFCQYCSAGSYSSATGLSVCSKCESGSFAPTEGSTSCISCESGTFGVGIGFTACVPCSIGYYSGSAGSTICSLCSAGTYTNKTSSSSCSSCQPGTYTSVESASVCSECTVGTYISAVGASANSCIECSAGTYASTTSASVCSNCMDATYTLNTGASACTTCPTCSQFGYYMADCSGGSAGICKKCVNT